MVTTRPQRKEPPNYREPPDPKINNAIEKKKAQDREDKKKRESKMKEIEGPFGNLETREQLIAAAEYRDSGQGSEEQTSRHDVLICYMKKNCNWVNAWDAYTLFELFDQLPEYFIPKDDAKDTVLESLVYLARLFIGVALRDALPLLDNAHEGESIANSGNTIAENFRAYLRRHKANDGFATWTSEHIRSARPVLLQAMKDSRVLPSRAVRVAGSANGSSSRSVTFSPGADMTGGSNGRAEETPEPIMPINPNSNSDDAQSTNGSGHDRLQSEEVSKEVKAEYAVLEELLGNITECAEIRRASECLDTVHNEIPKGTKTEAFKLYIDFHTDSDGNHIDQQRMHWELNFYRLTGETAGSVLDTSNGNSIEDFQLLHLIYLAQRWTSLSATSDLGELEDSVAVRVAKDEGGSVGQVIRAYLIDYRQQNGIRKWTEKNISGAGDRVVQVWNRVHTQRREKGKHPASEGAGMLSAAKRARVSQGGSSATVGLGNGSVATSSRTDLKHRRNKSPESGIYA